jgi:hypothetical protein
MKPDVICMKVLKSFNEFSKNTKKFEGSVLFRIWYLMCDSATDISRHLSDLYGETHKFLFLKLCGMQCCGSGTVILVPQRLFFAAQQRIAIT